MSIEAMRMALAYIRWNKFGECRTDGWEGEPPTAAEVDVALTNAIKDADTEEWRFQQFVSELQELERKACEIIQREWVGLTVQEIIELPVDDEVFGLVEVIEAKLKEKNT